MFQIIFILVGTSGIFSDPVKFLIILKVFGKVLVKDLIILYISHEKYSSYCAYSVM